jgi:hypothetical protein
MMVKCQDCEYSYWPEKEETGQCRIEPPRAFLMPQPSSVGPGITMKIISAFAPLSKEMACAKGKAKQN